MHMVNLILRIFLYQIVLGIVGLSKLLANNRCTQSMFMQCHKQAHRFHKCEYMKVHYELRFSS